MEFPGFILFGNNRYIIFRNFFGQDIYKITFSEQVISGFSCSFSNTVLLGIPIVLLAFGDKAALPLFIIIGTHGLVMFPLFTIMMEIGKIGDAPVKILFAKTSYGLITNPLVIGLLGGLVCNLLGITLWKPLDEIAKLLGNAVTPGALFALGATLAGFRKKIQWKELPILVLMKIIVHPLLVWLLAVIVFGLTEEIWIKVLVILAALPTGVNPFLFASRYNTGQMLSSGAVFISTFISIFTLSALLTFFRLSES